MAASGTDQAGYFDQMFKCSFPYTKFVSFARNHLPGHRKLGKTSTLSIFIAFINIFEVHLAAEPVWISIIINDQLD